MIQQLQNLSWLDLSSNSLFVVETSDDLSYNSTSPFPQMTSFQLASCGLKRFPEFLKDQTQLIVLDLSHNQLQGNVPTWIWKLENLVELNLSSNSLVGFLGPLLDQSCHLEVLDLSSNEFQGALPFITSYQPSYLDYSNNNFSSVIPEDIGKYLHWAIFFSISNNSVSGSIPTSLCNFTWFQVLDLSDNMLHGSVPTCLYEITVSLEVLNLKGNNLNGSLPDTFPSGCSLTTLDVSGNQIEGQVPQSLTNCAMLEVLDLKNNKMVDQFPCFLKSISSLRVLVLRSNKFHGEIECCKSDGMWPLLQIIDLSYNNFFGELPGRCLTSWQTMMGAGSGEKEKLNYLGVEVFGYRDTNYQQTVEVTTKGQEIKLVKILVIFTSIDFSSNRFRGFIPNEMTELKSLVILNLSHNSLTGQIPYYIGNLTALESLDLSSNSLNGAIPPQLGWLTFLSFLNLSHNQLEGRIPVGTQIQSFSAASFEGNKGLYGPPLTDEEEKKHLPPPSSQVSQWTLKSLVKWKYLSIELGFLFGLGIVIAPLTYNKNWRARYSAFIDAILGRIVPKLYS